MQVYLYQLSPCGEFVITLTTKGVLLYNLFPIKKIHQFEDIPNPIDVKWTLDGKQIIFEFSKKKIKYFPFNYLVYDAKTFELIENSVGFKLSLPKILFPSLVELESGNYGIIKPSSQPKVYFYDNYNLYIDNENQNISFEELYWNKGVYKYDKEYYNFSQDGNFISGVLNGFRIWKKTGELLPQNFCDPRIFGSENCIWLNNSQIILMKKDYSKDQDESYLFRNCYESHPVEVDYLHRIFSKPGKHKIFIYDFIKNHIVKSFEILIKKKYSASLNINNTIGMGILAISSISVESNTNTIDLINLQTENKIASFNGFIMNNIAVWASGGSALVYQNNDNEICLYDFLEEQKKNIILVQLKTYQERKKKLKITTSRLPHELWDLIFKEFSISMIK